MDFNFDEWMQLAKQDPTEFERRRTQAVTELIQAAPKETQPDLEKLQQQLDDIHNRYTPQEALLRMHELMECRVGLISRHLTELQNLLDSCDK